MCVNFLFSFFLISSNPQNPRLLIWAMFQFDHEEAVLKWPAYCQLSIKWQTADWLTDFICHFKAVEVLYTKVKLFCFLLHIQQLKSYIWRCISFFNLIFKILFTEKEETSIKTLRRRKTSIKQRPQVKAIYSVCICVFPCEKCLLYYLQCFTCLMLTMFKDLRWGLELLLNKYKLCFEGYKIGEKHICIHYSLTLKHWAETVMLSRGCRQRPIPASNPFYIVILLSVPSAYQLCNR